MLFSNTPREDLLQLLVAANPDNEFRLTPASTFYIDPAPGSVEGFNSQITLRGVSVGGLDGETTLNYNRLDLNDILSGKMSGEIALDLKAETGANILLSDIIADLNKAVGFKLTCGKPGDDFPIDMKITATQPGTSQIVELSTVGSFRLLPTTFKLTLVNDGVEFDSAVTTAYVPGFITKENMLKGDGVPDMLLDGKMDLNVLTRKLDFSDIFAWPIIMENMQQNPDLSYDYRHDYYNLKPESMAIVNERLMSVGLRPLKPEFKFSYYIKGIAFLKWNYDQITRATPNGPTAFAVALGQGYYNEPYPLLPGEKVSDGFLLLPFNLP